MKWNFRDKEINNEEFYESGSNTIPERLWSLKREGGGGGCVALCFSNLSINCHCQNPKPATTFTIYNKFNWNSKTKLIGWLEIQATITTNLTPNQSNLIEDGVDYIKQMDNDHYLEL